MEPTEGRSAEAARDVALTVAVGEPHRYCRPAGSVLLDPPQFPNCTRCRLPMEADVHCAGARLDFLREVIALVDWRIRQYLDTDPRLVGRPTPAEWRRILDVADHT